MEHRRWRIPLLLCVIMEFKDIKCDNAKCDHYEEVDFEDYPKYVNKPCPKCGDNLLTREDYNKCLIMLKHYYNLKKFFYPLRWFNPFFYYDMIFGTDENDIIEVQLPFPKKKKKS